MMWCSPYRLINLHDFLKWAIYRDNTWHDTEQNELWLVGQSDAVLDGLWLIKTALDLLPSVLVSGYVRLGSWWMHRLSSFKNIQYGIATLKASSVWTDSYSASSQAFKLANVTTLDLLHTILYIFRCINHSFHSHIITEEKLEVTELGIFRFLIHRWISGTGK